MMLYHFQIKERDEPRPRAGVLRTREFIMKDAYSFDRDQDGLDAAYELQREAYAPHLRPLRAGVVRVRVRRRDDGRHRRARVHGAVRRPARTTSCWRPATRRTSRSRPPSRSPSPRSSGLDGDLETPGLTTIEAVAGAPRRARRATCSRPSRWSPSRAALVLVFLRGDHRVDDDQAAQRARRELPARRSEDELHGPAGYLGPRRTSSRSSTRRVDARAATSPAPTAPDLHTVVAVDGRRAPDVRIGRGGRHGRRRGRPHRARHRGRQHLQARHALLRAAGRDVPRRARQGALDRMGSYGIGPARIAAAAVEQYADEQGIAWPQGDRALGRARSWRWARPARPSARRPRRVYARAARRAAWTSCSTTATRAPGEKFADAELLGVPAAPDGRQALGSRPGAGRGAGAPRAARTRERRAARRRRRRRSRGCGGTSRRRRAAVGLAAPAPDVQARLSGLDRSGPPPPQTLAGAPLNPWTIPNAIGFVRLALIPVFLVSALSATTTAATPARRSSSRSSPGATTPTASPRA